MREAPIDLGVQGDRHAWRELLGLLIWRNGPSSLYIGHRIIIPQEIGKALSISSLTADSTTIRPAAIAATSRLVPYQDAVGIQRAAGAIGREGLLQREAAGGD